MTSGVSATGIYAITAGAGVVVVQAGAAGSVSTTGNYSRGIVAYAADGPVTVSGGSVSTTGRASTGIVAAGGTGAVTVTIANDSTTGDFSDAVDAIGTGQVAVTAGNVSTSGNNSTGILALSNGGAVNVTSQSITTAGDDATGIEVQGAGDVTVTSGSVKTAGADATGIDAASIGGNTTISITGAGVTSAQGDAVYARGGNVSITTGAGSTINGAEDGLLIEASTGANLTLAGTLDSGNGYAIDAPSGGPVIVANSGTINGRVRLSGGDDVVNNSGTFNATADSDFPGRRNRHLQQLWDGERAAGDDRPRHADFHRARAVQQLGHAQPAERTCRRPVRPPGRVRRLGR